MGGGRCAASVCCSIDFALLDYSPDPASLYSRGDEARANLNADTREYLSRHSITLRK